MTTAIHKYGIYKRVVCIITFLIKLLCKDISLVYVVYVVEMENDQLSSLIFPS